MYKIKFNKYQKSVFKTVEFNGDKKRKIMSVYSYLIKYSDKNGTVTKSLTKLHKMYLRYHKKISLAYFKQISTILINLELLKKIDNSLIVVSEKIAKKIADTEVTETVENTSLDSDLNLPNKELEYIYTNTLNVRENNFNDEIVPLAMVYKKIMELCKVVTIKNKAVKEMIYNLVMSRLKKYKIELRQSTCDTYLLKCILEKYNFIRHLNANRYVCGSSEYQKVNAKQIAEIEMLAY